MKRMKGGKEGPGREGNEEKEANTRNTLKEGKKVKEGNRREWKGVKKREGKKRKR